MTKIQLSENKPSSVPLSDDQAIVLATALPELAVRPVLGQRGMFELTAPGIVGQVDVGDLSLRIAPKVPFDSLLFLLAYSIDSRHWKELHTVVGTQDSLLDAIAVVFGRELSRALGQGLVRNYVERDDQLQTVKGRIRTDVQVRRWFGRMPPVECRFDEFTEDILENRLIKAALLRLRHVRIRNPQARIQLRHAEHQLEDVSTVNLTAQAADDVVFTRLNERLRRSVAISRLILSSVSVTIHERSAVQSSGFIVNLAALFETFVLTAFTEQLAHTGVRVPAKKVSRFVDEGERFRLIPDLVFQAEGKVVAVGDVKYKKTPGKGANEPDIYQVLTYARAFGVPDALLVYPKGEFEADGTHAVRVTGERLRVLALDLAARPDEIQRAIEEAAAWIAAVYGRQPKTLELAV